MNIAHIIRSFDLIWQGPGTSSNIVSEQFGLPVLRDAQCFLLRMSVKAVWYVAGLDPTPTGAAIQLSFAGGNRRVGIDIDPTQAVTLSGTLSTQQLMADSYADWVGRLPMHNSSPGINYTTLVTVAIPVGAAAFDPVQLTYCLEIENS